VHFVRRTADSRAVRRTEAPTTVRSDGRGSRATKVGGQPPTAGRIAVDGRQPATRRPATDGSVRGGVEHEEAADI